jgi:hypothetical protein
MGDTVVEQPAAPAMPIAPLARVVRALHRSIPRSLVLAVIGIVLSSWLIPAFTRQWDDRQKAGELKAALVADMATATGRVLLAAQASPAASANSRPQVLNIVALNEWSIDSLKIRARLDAYFGPEAVREWAVLTKFINATLSRAYDDAYIPGRLWPATTPSGRLQDLYSEFYDGHLMFDDMASQLLREEESVARHILARHVRGYSTTWHDIVGDLIPKA